MHLFVWYYESPNIIQNYPQNKRERACFKLIHEIAGG